MKYSEQGGGPTVGLGNDFVSFLQNGLNTGTFGTSQFNGADPVGGTVGIAGVLNDILSGSAGQIGGSINDMINRTVQRQALDLRSRYDVSGGNAFGTGARTAETRLRAEAAPQLTQAIGNLQLGAIGQLLPMIASFASKGITQREGAYQENPWVTGINTVGNLARSVASFIPGTNPGYVPSTSTVSTGNIVNGNYGQIGGGYQPINTPMMSTLTPDQLQGIIAGLGAF